MEDNKNIVADAVKKRVSRIKKLSDGTEYLMAPRGWIRITPKTFRYDRAKKRLRKSAQRELFRATGLLEALKKQGLYIPTPVAV